MKKTSKKLLKVNFIIFSVLIALLISVGGGEEKEEPKEEVVMEEPKEEVEVEEQAKEEEPKEEEPKEEEKEEQKTDINVWTEENYTTFRAITEMSAEEFVTGFKTPWSNDDYTFAKFDDEKVVVLTKYTFEGIVEKQEVACIFTPVFDEDGSCEGFTTHYLGIGNKVYIDDGACDEMFEKLSGE